MFMGITKARLGRVVGFAIVCGTTRFAVGLAAPFVADVSTARSDATDSPVADAAMRGDSAKVRLLLKQGMDANAAQADGMTALHWAAARGDVEQARMLIFAGARVEASTRNGSYTPLHLASQAGRAAVVKALLDAGANANDATSSGGATALHMAAAQGSVETVAALIDHKATVDSRETAWGQTPLMWAAAYNRVAALELLIAKGASIEAFSKVENIPEREKADRAANALRNRKVLALKGAEQPAAAPAPAGGGRGGRAGSPGQAAGPGAGPAQPKTMATPATAQPKPGTPAADSALAAIAPKSVSGRDTAKKQAEPKKETNKDAPKTISVPRGESPKPDEKKPPTPPTDTSKSAAQKAPTKPVNSTVEDEDRPRIGGSGGNDPTAAGRPGAGRGNDGSLSYGDLVGNKGGLTPLLFAVRQGNTESVKALLKAGAKINHVSEGDHTSPLLMATINGQFDLATYLLENKADPKLASDAGATPLYATINVQWAAKSLYPQPTAQLQQGTTYLQLMEALLKAGANPNVRLTKHLWYMSYNFDLLGVNTTGATPFWRAAYGTDVDAMKLLVKYGADPTIPTMKPAGRIRSEDGPAEDENAGGDKTDPSGLPPVPAGGPGVYPIHAATGVGYGEGYAANAHRHAPDSWITSAKYLIEELHADVNARDFNGYNPLHHAAARGDTALAAYLISKGGDIKAVSRRGQTITDMANGPVQRIPPFEEAVKWFEKAGSANSHKCKSC